MNYTESVNYVKALCMSNPDHFIEVSLVLEGPGYYIGPDADGSLRREVPQLTLIVGFHDHDPELSFIPMSCMEEQMENLQVCEENGVMPDKLGDSLMFHLVRMKPQEEKLYVAYNEGNYILLKESTKVRLFFGELELVDYYNQYPIIKVDGVQRSGYKEISLAMWGDNRYNYVGDTMRYLKPLLDGFVPNMGNKKTKVKYNREDIVSAYVTKSKSNLDMPVFTHSNPRVGMVRGWLNLMKAMEGITFEDVVELANDYGLPMNNNTVKGYLRRLSKEAPKKESPEPAVHKINRDIYDYINLYDIEVVDGELVIYNSIVDDTVELVTKDQMVRILNSMGEYPDKKTATNLWAHLQDMLEG